MKRLMAENFGNVQKILIDLVRSDYAPVAREVGVIEEHAGDLVDSPPEAANINKPMFVSLAFSLQTHAHNLRTVAEALAKRDAVIPVDGPYLAYTLRRPVGVVANITAFVDCVRSGHHVRCNCIARAKEWRQARVP